MTPGRPRKSGSVCDKLRTVVLGRWRKSLASAIASLMVDTCLGCYSCEFEIERHLYRVKCVRNESSGAQTHCPSLAVFCEPRKQTIDGTRSERLSSKYAPNVIGLGVRRRDTRSSPKNRRGRDLKSIIAVTIGLSQRIPLAIPRNSGSVWESRFAKHRQMRKPKVPVRHLNIQLFTNWLGDNNLKLG